MVPAEGVKAFLGKRAHRAVFQGRHGRRLGKPVDQTQFSKNLVFPKIGDYPLPTLGGLSGNLNQSGMNDIKTIAQGVFLNDILTFFVIKCLHTLPIRNLVIME